MMITEFAEQYKSEMNESCGIRCNQNPANELECVEIDIHYLSNDSLIENCFIGDEKHLDYMLEIVDLLKSDMEEMSIILQNLIKHDSCLSPESTSSDIDYLNALSSYVNNRQKQAALPHQISEDDVDPAAESSESEESFYSVQSSPSLEYQSDLPLSESTDATFAPFRLPSSTIVTQTRTVECNENKSDNENGGCGPTVPPFMKSTRIQHGRVMKIATMYGDVSPQRHASIRGQRSSKFDC